jgi:multidrug efflux pump subunit AcrA (membrane-fusion protein)
MSAATPCLRADLSIVEQTYRGTTSFVVKDLAAQKYYRFGANEVRVMRCFDGRSTFAEIARALRDQGMKVSVAAVEGFARKLAGSGFLERTLEERTTLQMERLRSERRQRRRTPLFRGELLRMRWSVGDPDTLLSRTLPALRWMYTPTFILTSLVLFAVYGLILAQGWPTFTAALSAAYGFHHLTVARGLLFWLMALVVILIHELGHGYTCKYFGGEVRELGFMLLYFQPAFFCNVSDAWSFPERRARLWVTAAGTWIQLIVASIAAIVWWAAAPGTVVADAAIAVMLVGGFTTVFTNANPLIPLDGYFALADWLEIGNLRHRAYAHLRWWLRQRIFRLEAPEPPATARERRVFLTYGVLSSLYIAGLFGFLASLAFGWVQRALGGVGATFAVLALAVAMRKSLADWGRAALLAVRAARGRRPRMARGGLGVGIALIALIALMLAPWNLTTNGSFTAASTLTQSVVAPDSGIVADVFVSGGSRVAAGAPLLRLVDLSLDQQLLVATRAIDSLTRAEIGARAAGSIGEATRLAAERDAAAATLAALEERASRLTVRAVAAGVVATPRPEELSGRLALAGDSLLTLIVSDSVELRITLPKAGSVRVHPGQVVHAVSYADVAHPWTGEISTVSAGADAGVTRNGVLEVRARRGADAAWRVGTSGESSVVLGRSTVFGALWWKARQLLRTDFLL